MRDGCQYLFFVRVRARARITSPVWALIHPVWQRCSSFPYEEYVQSSRLARHASQHPNREVILARTLSESYPVWLKKRTLRMLKKAASLRQGYGRHASGVSLPSRGLAVAATTRKRAGRSPFCRAHGLHVRSAHQHGCGLSFDKLRTGLDEPLASARACFLTIPSKSD